MRTKIALALSIAFSFSAPSAAQQSVAPEPILVTGERIEDSLKNLEDCLSRDCPPEEDIELTLAHAENLFVSGEYKKGQQALRASIGRTDEHADRLPVPVAGLYRASARFAEHLGEARDYQLSTLDMRDTLKKGLGRDHWRTLVADLTVGDSRAKLGLPDDAERIYKRTEKRAIEYNQPRVAMFARIRQALLLQARHESEKRDFWRRQQIELLKDIRDNPISGAEDFAFIAEVMLANIDRDNGDMRSTEALIANYAENGGAERPVLLTSDPLFDDVDIDRETSRSDTAQARLSTTTQNRPQWADIGFTINADGKVSGFEILRSEGNTRWLEQVERHITSRRYAPLAEREASTGLFQIERYTRISRFADQTSGTRIRRREPVYRIERLDITPESYTESVGAEG